MAKCALPVRPLICAGRLRQEVAGAQLPVPPPDVRG